MPSDHVDGSCRCRVILTSLPFPYLPNATQMEILGSSKFSILTDAQGGCCGLALTATNSSNCLVERADILLYSYPLETLTLPPFILTDRFPETACLAKS